MSKINTIIVLTSWMKEDAKFSSGWKSDLPAHIRVAAAAKIYHAIEGEKPYFLITGGRTYGDSRPSLSRILGEEAVRKYGISRDKLLLEEASKDTTENAEFSKDLLNRNNLTPQGMLVVTSGYHLNRSKEVFNMYSLHPDMINAEDVLRKESTRHEKFIEGYLQKPEVAKMNKRNGLSSWILKNFGAFPLRVYAHLTRSSNICARINKV